MEGNALSKAIEFKKLEKKHKEAWFNFKKDFKAKALELLKKCHTEKYDLCIQKMEDIQKNGFSDELVHKYLHKKIELMEKSMQDWEKLCAEKDKTKKELKEKCKQDIEQFKQSCK